MVCDNGYMNVQAPNLVKIFKIKTNDFLLFSPNVQRILFNLFRYYIRRSKFKLFNKNL